MADEINTWNEDEGATLANLARDGALVPIVDAILRPVERDRDALREVAVQKTAELTAFKAALADVEAETDRRLRRPHLRAVEEANTNHCPHLRRDRVVAGDARLSRQAEVLLFAAADRAPAHVSGSTRSRATDTAARMAHTSTTFWSRDVSSDRDARDGQAELLRRREVKEMCGGY